MRSAQLTGLRTLVMNPNMSHRISDGELQAALSGLPGWEAKDDHLVKSFTFDSFREAVTAMVRMSYEVEETNHHPDILISYNTLEVRLCTHDAGDKITDKDLRLAALIEKVVGLNKV
jgi:4a-hydroxytetrahydrobiopterin dehydratase